MPLSELPYKKIIFRAQKVVKDSNWKIQSQPASAATVEIWKSATIDATSRLSTKRTPKIRNCVSETTTEKSAKGGQSGNALRIGFRSNWMEAEWHCNSQFTSKFDYVYCNGILHHTLNTEWRLVNLFRAALIID